MGARFVAALLLLLLVVAVASDAVAPCKPLPRYDGLCMACATKGFYCPIDDTCWSTSACAPSLCSLGVPAGESMCYGIAFQCSKAPFPGTLPQFHGNCRGCVSAIANATYCRRTDTCYFNATACRQRHPGQCNATCQ